MEENESATRQQENPGEQPKDKDVDWEARYKGAMRALNEKVDALKQAHERIAELEKLYAEANAQLEQHKSKIGDLTGQLEEFAKQSQQLRGELVRWKVIAEEPDLIPFVDLIPPSEDESQVREVVRSVSSRLSSILERKMEQLRQGSTPPAQASRDSSMTPDAVMRELMAMASGEKPMDEGRWNALNDLLTKFIGGEP